MECYITHFKQFYKKKLFVKYFPKHIAPIISLTPYIFTLLISQFIVTVDRKTILTREFPSD